MPAADLPRLLTITEVAKALRCSPPTVYALVRSNQLPAVTFSTDTPGRKTERGVFRVTEEALVDFVRNHTQGVTR
ncbi:MAG: helix-turn-helix domain-containing protein [Thermodesulfobacteriota bacterium]